MPENNVNSTINAVKGLAEAIPVYQDAVQPAAKELGKSLATVAKTVNIALAPISAMVWGYEKISEYVQQRVSALLEKIPRERIIVPDAAVVGPSLEALRFTGKDETLRELYANLIATAMNQDEASSAHPSFVEIIKNICADEAILFEYLTRAIPEERTFVDAVIGENIRFENFTLIDQESPIVHKKRLESYVDNLTRLGLISIPEHSRLYTYDSVFEKLENHENLKSHPFAKFFAINIAKRKIIQITSFGRLFSKACINSDNPFFDASDI